MTVITGLGPALRIARRDTLRHKGNSLLIIILIALPILVMAAADVLLRSSFGTPAERADLTLGRADLGAASAWIEAPAGAPAVVQYGPTDDGFNFDTGPGVAGYLPSAHPLRPASEVLALLPAGAELAPWVQTEVPAKGVGGQYFRTDLEMLDLAATAAAGRFRVTAGTAPAGPGQVALTPALAKRLDTGIGAVVSLGAPAAAYTVVGMVQSLVPSDKPGDRSIAVTDFGQVKYFESYRGPRYLMSGVSLSWSEVEGLNKHGLGVFSRAAISGPGATAVPEQQQSESVLMVAGAVLGGLLAVMQVIFLAGPAFAVGAKRMRRQLGQLGAAGATPGQLRLVVLGSGLVLGALGSGLGVLLGVAAGLAGRGVAVEKLGLPYVATHVVPADLLAIFALGLLTAMLAALLPAISASRASVMALLGQSPVAKRTIRWWSIAGAVTALIGIGVTLAVALSGVTEAQRAQPGELRAVVIGAGLLLTEIGLLMGTPLLLRVIARLGRVLPTMPRLAVRDAARHSGRSAPAVAAVMTVTALAVALTSLFATLELSRADNYTPGIPLGAVMVQPADPKLPPTDTPADTGVSAAGLSAIWPKSTFAILTTPTGPTEASSVDPQIPAGNGCPWMVSHYASLVDGSIRGLALPTPAEIPAAVGDWRCAGADYSTVSDEQSGTHASGIRSGLAVPRLLVGGPELRALVTGIEDPAADRVLAAGGTVTLDRRFLSPAGVLTLAQSHYEGTKDEWVQDRVISLNASAARWSPTRISAIVSPSAAREAGLRTVSAGLIIDPGGVATADQTDSLQQQLAAGGSQVFTYLETGQDSLTGGPSPWLIFAAAALLIALTVAVVTALSVSDARDDLSTLGAVGAPGWMRRRFSGWSAMLITGIGCVLGALLGLVPAFGLVRLVYQSGGFPKPYFEVPWGPIAVLIVGLPLLAFVVAATVTGSRISLVARAR
ncbi:putative ABC transport system permease protein [Nakamurella sp. UYEF19]|uniref:FtsX-like permease family protein n=1 Tax=Nakamurella sp. UYEF19 TaxID=1756392 RepID=UPI0033945550